MNNTNFETQTIYGYCKNENSPYNHHHKFDGSKYPSYSCSSGDDDDWGTWGGWSIGAE